MRQGVLAAVLALAAGAAEAECLTAQSAQTGVIFTREDGSKGTLVATGEGMMRVDYAFGRKDKISKVNALYGIYTQEAVAWQGDPEAVGGRGATVTKFNRSGREPLPEAGKTWKTRLRTVQTTADDSEAGSEVSRANYRVTYSYQAPREVSLSGCAYQMMPVEATFVGTEAHFTRRWAFFPDLGFGLETMYTDHRNGIETRMGLTALRMPK